MRILESRAEGSTSVPQSFSIVTAHLAIQQTRYWIGGVSLVAKCTPQLSGHSHVKGGPRDGAASGSRIRPTPRIACPSTLRTGF